MISIELVVWWVVCGWAPASCGAILAIAALRSDYGYRARHAANGRRRSAPSTWALSPLGVDTPDLRVARVKVAQVAEAIEQRVARWNDGRTDTELAEEWLGITDVEPVAELHRHDPAAGALAYLAVSPAALDASLGETTGALPREARIDTAEMHIRFGHALAATVGPQAESDEWALPDEDGPDDRAPGRHRGRTAVMAR